mmetsp:Transcript_4238/g.15884  ORF Transcript_4238/g.15884 Transcript_4238/m.15884 type:complete len:425 (+) Transcript_4238:632-1906(+)
MHRVHLERNDLAAVGPDRSGDIHGGVPYVGADLDRKHGLRVLRDLVDDDGLLPSGDLQPERAALRELLNGHHAGVDVALGRPAQDGLQGHELPCVGVRAFVLPRGCDGVDATLHRSHPSLGRVQVERLLVSCRACRVGLRQAGEEGRRDGRPMPRVARAHAQQIPPRLRYPPPLREAYGQGVADGRPHPLVAGLLRHRELEPHLPLRIGTMFPGHDHGRVARGAHRSAASVRGVEDGVDVVRAAEAEERQEQHGAGTTRERGADRGLLDPLQGRVHDRVWLSELGQGPNHDRQVPAVESLDPRERTVGDILDEALRPGQPEHREGVEEVREVDRLELIALVHACQRQLVHGLGVDVGDLRKAPGRVGDVLWIEVLHDLGLREVRLAEPSEEAVVSVADRAKSPNHVAHVDWPQLLLRVPFQGGR